MFARPFRSLLLMLGLLAGPLSPLLGQAPPATPPVAAPAVSPLLGDEWDGSDLGIVIRSPAGMKVIQRGLGQEELVRFVDDQNRWLITLGRVTLEKPVALQTRRSVNGDMVAGFLDATADAMKKDLAGTIVRKEMVYLTDAEAGAIAVHYTMGTTTQLVQRALIRLTDTQYYILTFTIPAPRQNPERDPMVMKAVQTFNAMLDSARLIDQSKVRQDQEERLIRTRNLLLNATEARLRGMLVPEQWLRLMRDGKDIGYSYIVEEIAADIPRRGAKPRSTGLDGVLVGVRSRSRPDAKVQVDTESWLWMSMDRKQENWSNVFVVNQGQPDENYRSEIGFSVRRAKPEVDRLVDEWVLDVKYSSKRQALESVQRQLPPFYLPQALNHLLPRLLPIREPKSYLFATYIGDSREVMLRYIDVLAEADVTFNGQRRRAVVVQDRIGLRGSTTLHYYSADGTYLGSENKDAAIVILPTDAATLRRIWNDVELTRPQAVEKE
jgi:hypothetical protein